MNRQIDADTAPSLLLRIREHDDKEAWKKFVEVYSPLIYGYCRSKRLQASDAADITQEVLLRVAKAIKSFDYDSKIGLFRDWLAQVVQNEVRRFVSRRKQFDVLHLDGLVQPGGSDDWNEKFQQRVFEMGLANTKPQFSEQTWGLFERSWLKKQSPSDVVESMSVNVEHVYVARSRVIKQLRKEVAILVDDSIVQ